MRGVGGAAYLAPTTTTVADLAPVLESADIDGDGRADVIAARVATGTSAVLVALGQAGGTLAEPLALPIASVASYLRAEADFNRDGAPDLVTTDINTQTMVILPSNPWAPGVRGLPELRAPESTPERAPRSCDAPVLM